MLPTANEKTKMEGASSSLHIYDNDVVYEIFTWLPARSLMRFKNLSKFWNRNIAGDSYFVQIHRRRAVARPGGEKLLLHLHNNIHDRQISKKTFISIDEFDRNHLGELYFHSCPYEPFTVPLTVVDGLVCFYGESGSSFSASLHNLFTHESIALPEDSNFSNEFQRRNSKFKNEFQRTISLFIGFDSSHTVCKILRKINLIDYQTAFEIYTVGGANNSWRIINTPPFECPDCYPDDSGACINGVIYWISSCNSKEDNKSCRGFKIKAFDVNDEKFHLISVPPGCQLDRLRNVDGLLTLFVPHLPLFRPDYVIDLWKLKDYKNQVWVKESISVDVSRGYFSLVVLVGTNGSGEILMTKQLRSGAEALIYYDRARNTSRVKELDIYYDSAKRISKVGQLYVYSDGEVLGTYVESIMPLTAIIN